LTCGTNAHCYSPSTSTDKTCKCNDGYTSHTGDTSCTDIDECAAAVNTHTCKINGDSGATCVNLVPSFKCTCSSTTGWSLVSNDQRCIDINECNAGTHSCHADATCDNIDGGYNCTCNSGYYGNGLTGSELTCTDTNECAATDTYNCPDMSTCSNTPGSYDCVCNTGYEKVNGSCVDIDECNSTLTCHQNATCANTVGSYDCTCNTGHEGNGNTSSTGCTAMTACGNYVPVLYCTHAQYCDTDATCKSKKAGGNTCNNRNDECLHNKCGSDDRCKDPTGTSCNRNFACFSDSCTDNKCV